MQRLCCCCGDKPEKNNLSESVVVVNDDGAIITQPTNKSANNSFKFHRSNGSQNDGFVNDAVEFDEIDLNERQMSVRSRDKFNNNVNGHCPPQANQKPAEDTIHVTGLMLDQLYEDDEKVEEKTQNDDQVSREIVEDYNFDPDAVTEVSPDDLKPPEEEHRLTINLADEPTFCYCSDKSSLTSEVTCEPVAAPRNKSASPNSAPPEPPSVSPPPWSPIKNCCDEEPVHVTTKSEFELGVNDLDIVTNDFTEQPTTSVSSVPSDPNTDEPPYPAIDDQVIHEKIQKNRMYADSSSSSSSSCDSDNEPNEFELESLQTTDRQHKKEDEYSILNEETDKSNAG